MTNDDRFDDILQEAAREHNAAPETPRAEMWAAIAAARGGKRAEPVAAPVVERPAPEVRVIPLFTRHRRALGWVAAMAATLLIGVMIGRRSATTGDAPRLSVIARATLPVPDTQVATSPRAVDNGGGSGPGPVIGLPGGPSVAARGTTTTVASLPNGSRGRDLTGPDARERTGPTRSRLAPRDAALAAALPYRMAALQHLATTEALLVSLRSDVRSGRSDTTIAVWAGDLLGTTRMLIDSPAGRDPQLKQLLEDLELVLAQISRLPGAHGEAADLGLIDDAVRRREIMTRLRALSPNT